MRRARHRYQLMPVFEETSDDAFRYFSGAPLPSHALEWTRGGCCTAQAGFPSGTGPLMLRTDRDGASRRRRKGHPRSGTRPARTLREEARLFLRRTIRPAVPEGDDWTRFSPTGKTSCRKARYGCFTSPPFSVSASAGSLRTAPTNRARPRQGAAANARNAKL